MLVQSIRATTALSALDYAYVIFDYFLPLHQHFNARDAHPRSGVLDTQGEVGGKELQAAIDDVF
jgi:hypothetical protein